MFTGIITHLGEIVANKSGVLAIKASNEIITHLSNGMSIAVDGICLTVVNLNTEKHEFEVNYMPETENKTNVKYLKDSDLVNLELPVSASNFLAGYIVQGHIDTVSQILQIEKDGNSYIFAFSINPDFSKYIVDKGSIIINGISLTVIKTLKDSFTVGIIPYTWENTMLHQSKIGDYVNIEVDVLAKYVEKLMNK